MDWVTLGQQTFIGLTNGMNYAVFAVSLTLIFGVMQVINMAHGELYMLGAMLSYTFMTLLGLNFYLAAVLGIIIVALAGFVINRVAVEPLINVPRLNTLISTIAVSLILMYGSATVWGEAAKRIETPLPVVFRPGTIAISGDSIILFAGGVVGIAALYWLLSRTKLGAAIRATAQNVMGASLIGIDIKRVRDYTFIVAAALAALGGILAAPINMAFPEMGQGVLVKAFAITIAAGLGNIPGAIVMGLSIGVLEAFFVQYAIAFYKVAFIYGIMIVLLLLKPQGLFARR